MIVFFTEWYYTNCIKVFFKKIYIYLNYFFISLFKLYMVFSIFLNSSLYSLKYFRQRYPLILSIVLSLPWHHFSSLYNHSLHNLLKVLLASMGDILFNSINRSWKAQHDKNHKISPISNIKIILLDGKGRIRKSYIFNIS